MICVTDLTRSLTICLTQLRLFRLLVLLLLLLLLLLLMLRKCGHKSLCDNLRSFTQPGRHTTLQLLLLLLLVLLKLMLQLLLLMQKHRRENRR